MSDLTSIRKKASKKKFKHNDSSVEGDDTKIDKVEDNNSSLLITDPIQNLVKGTVEVTVEEEEKQVEDDLNNPEETSSVESSTNIPSITPRMKQSLVMNVISHSEIKPITALNFNNIQECYNSIRGLNATPATHPVDRLMDIHTMWALDLKFQQEKVPNHTEWRSWDYHQTLFPILKELFPPEKGTAAATPLDKIKLLSSKFQKISVHKEQTFFQLNGAIRELLMSPLFQNLDPDTETGLVKKMFELMGPSKDEPMNNKSNKRFLQQCKDKLLLVRPTSIDKFITEYFSIYSKARKTLNEAIDMFSEEDIMQAFKSNHSNNKSSSGREDFFRRCNALKGREGKDSLGETVL